MSDGLNTLDRRRHPALALGELSLFLVNLICVNLASVTTFLAQGIKSTSWWEKDGL